MIEKTIIFNIKLCIDNLEDFNKYNKAFEVFVKDFKHCIKSYYFGKCRIQMSIGNFEFLYPDMIRKKMLPQLHIIASGRDARNIDEFIERFINDYFDLATYQKFYLNKNPFSRRNNNLFSNIAYKRFILNIKKHK